MPLRLFVDLEPLAHKRAICIVVASSTYMAKSDAHSSQDHLPIGSGGASGMSNENSAQEALLCLSEVEGQLSSAHNASTLRWSVTVGNNGAIALVFQPIDLTSATAWLFDAGFAQGRTLPRLSIRGATSDGIVVESDYVYVLDLNTTTDATGTKLFLSGNTSRLRLVYRRLPETSRGVHATYLTVGMRALGCPSVDTSLGSVTLVAPTKIDDPEHINSRVHIQASEDERPLAEWLSGCDRLVEQILDMISFAEGGFIRWSVRKIESEEGILAIDCDGAKGMGPAWDGAFHYLNLQPVLDLAVTRYTEKLCQTTGLAIALEWFVHHPRYAELQLISAMTALEHLVGVFVQNHGAPKIVPQELFDSLLKTTNTLWKAMEKSPKADQAAIERLKRKLTNANEGSFRDKLEGMLKAYNVPLFGLELDRISNAVAARNRVVHRGLYRSKKEQISLQEHVAVIRELLKRIFLTLLQYQGQYYSLLNGPEWIEFPPTPLSAPARSTSSPT